VRHGSAHRNFREGDAIEQLAMKSGVDGSHIERDAKRASALSKSDPE
jgi:hypothetical protein